MSKAERAAILAKTAGSCHVCGGPAGDGWQADHVIPHAKGGTSLADNFLPACRTCNALRWFREPEEIRRVLEIGVYFAKELRKGSPLGLQLAEYVEKRRIANAKRRKAPPAHQ